MYGMIRGTDERLSDLHISSHSQGCDLQIVLKKHVRRSADFRYNHVQYTSYDSELRQQYLTYFAGIQAIILSIP
jgi:hypothetical protein